MIYETGLTESGYINSINISKTNSSIVEFSGGFIIFDMTHVCVLLTCVIRKTCFMHASWEKLQANDGVDNDNKNN